MFDIGWSEMLVIAAVAILVVGPRELPSMLRNLGKYMGQIRRMAGEFQSQFNDALKEAELDEVRRGIESVRSASPGKQLRKELGSLKEAGDSVRKAVEDPGAPKTGETAAPAGSQSVKPDPEAPAAEKPSPKPAGAKAKPAEASAKPAEASAKTAGEAPAKPAGEAPATASNETKTPTAETAS